MSKSPRRPPIILLDIGAGRPQGPGDDGRETQSRELSQIGTSANDNNLRKALSRCNRTGEVGARLRLRRSRTEERRREGGTSVLGVLALALLLQSLQSLAHGGCVLWRLLWYHVRRRGVEKPYLERMAMVMVTLLVLRRGDSRFGG